MEASKKYSDNLSSVTLKNRILALDPYSRHKQLINQYFLYYPGSTSQLKRHRGRDKTDFDVIREHHQFLWASDDVPDIWEKKLAKKYYDKLFKEYCITDLYHYKENKIALRWRTEKEVIDGKGQFICGDKRCMESEKLRSWEVNFGYIEQGEKKNALVKLRLCPDCSFKLNYHYQRKEFKRTKKRSHEEDAEITSNKRSKESEIENAVEESNDPKAGCSVTTESSEIWKAKINISEEKSREEEFEEYLNDMLL